jgi:hypothetical protein
VPTTTAPDASVTVPAIIPFSNWASAADESSSRTASAAAIEAKPRLHGRQDVSTFVIFFLL